MKNLKKISRKELKTIAAGSIEHEQDNMEGPGWTPCAQGCKAWEICCGQYNGFTYCNNGPCPR